MKNIIIPAKLSALAAVLLLILVLIATPPPPIQSSPDGIGTYIIKSNPSLNVRSEPNAATEKIGEIPNGQTVEVSSVQGKWGYVKMYGGWIHLDYAVFQSDEAKAGIYKVNINSGLELRKGSSSNYKTIQIIPFGTELDIKEFSQNWGKTEYNGQTGWVYMPDCAKIIPPQDKLLEIAENEIGYKEKHDNDTKYGEWYGQNNIDWCAIFVSWCAEKAGIPENIILRFNECQKGVDWFKEQKLWKDRESGYVPKKGDIVFFDWELDGIANHATIAEKAEDGKVIYIGGNTAENDVARKSMDLTESYIIGYALPDYESAYGS